VNPNNVAELFAQASDDLRAASLLSASGVNADTRDRVLDAIHRVQLAVGTDPSWPVRNGKGRLTPTGACLMALTVRLQRLIARHFTR
jgi:hypothetical protein